MTTLTFEKQDTQLQLRRTFAHSQETLWNAWTTPKLLAQWFRPNDSIQTTVVEHDFVVGGKYHLKMGAFDLFGEFLTIEPMGKLSFTWFWEGQDNMKTQVTIQLIPVENNETELVLTHSQFTGRERVDEHAWGWDGCLTNLIALLESANTY